MRETHWRTGHSAHCSCGPCEEREPTPQMVNAMLAELALLRELEAWVRRQFTPECYSTLEELLPKLDALRAGR